MTRKRFVKLCMARGYSRNEAQEGAIAEIGRVAAAVAAGLAAALEAFFAAFNREMG